MASINIAGIDKAEIFAALYNNARPLGLTNGFFLYVPGDITPTEAALILSRVDKLVFDYVDGRVMKIDLSGDVLRTGLYDRDNGEGAARRALAHLLPPDR